MLGKQSLLIETLKSCCKSIGPANMKNKLCLLKLKIIRNMFRQIVLV